MISVEMHFSLCSLTFVEMEVPFLKQMNIGWWTLTEKFSGSLNKKKLSAPSVLFGKENIFLVFVFWKYLFNLKSFGY